MARTLGFEDENEANVEGLSPKEELSNKNLLALKKEIMVITFLCESLNKEYFKHIGTASGIIDDNDANK
jgi:hypothetical protein